MFGKLRQASGGTYFINIEQVVQKVAIYKAKLCLDLLVNFDKHSLSSDHSCRKCSYFAIRVTPADVFQSLPELEQSLSKEVKMALVYIAGYVTRKSSTTDDTDICVEEYGAYFKELNRGGLTFPYVLIMSRTRFRVNPHFIVV